MNMIEVLKLPIGRKLNSNLEKGTIYEVCSSFNNKCLKIKVDPENDILKRNIIVPLDSEITEADFKIIK